MNRLKRVVVVCMMMASLMIPLSTPEFDSISGVVSTSDAASVRYTKKQAGRKLEKWWSIKNRDPILPQAFTASLQRRIGKHIFLKCIRFI